MSFSGEPSSDGFANRYELDYQPKKVVVDGFVRFQQFGVINFHVRRGGEWGLTLSTKNKWLTGWMKAWFYCKVPLHVCIGGGGIHPCSLFTRERPEVLHETLF
jgi:hypothetical protein